MFGTRHPEPSQPPRATPATPIRSGQVAPGRFVQGPLRDPTRGPGFGRSLRCVFRSTGSAEGGGGGDEDLWVWDSRKQNEDCGFGVLFPAGNGLFCGGSRLWVSVPMGHGLLFGALFQGICGFDCIPKNAFMVGLWVCCDGGFVGFLMVVCGGLRWWVCCF
uniref:Transmembrane protein n=1 Tax=Fagus sylvatica TaxID=28930 RepID=A0A2N9FDP5_FAGSY